MAYDKQEWRNKDKSTPLSASRLLHIEDGIKGAHDAVENLPEPSNEAPSWGDVTDKPSSFTPEDHTHEAADISDSSAFSRGLIRTSDAAGARAHLKAAAASDIPTVPEPQFTSDEVEKLKALIADEGESEGE